MILNIAMISIRPGKICSIVYAGVRGVMGKQYRQTLWPTFTPWLKPRIIRSSSVWHSRTTQSNKTLQRLYHKIRPVLCQKLTLPKPNLTLSQFSFVSQAGLI